MEQTKRPAVVWIVATVFLIFAIVVVILVGSSVTRHLEIALRDPFGMIAFPAIKLATIAATAIGLLRRWRWSQWAGAILLVVWVALVALHEVQGPVETPVANSMGVESGDASYRLGRLIGMIIFCSLILWASIALAFGSNARRYFRGNEDSAEPAGPDQRR